MTLYQILGIYTIHVLDVSDTYWTYLARTDDVLKISWCWPEWELEQMFLKSLKIF